MRHGLELLKEPRSKDAYVAPCLLPLLRRAWVVLRNYNLPYEISMHSAKAVYIPLVYLKFFSHPTLTDPSPNRQDFTNHRNTCGFDRIGRLSEFLRLVLAMYSPHTIASTSTGSHLNDLRTDGKTYSFGQSHHKSPRPDIAIYS